MKILQSTLKFHIKKLHTPLVVFAFTLLFRQSQDYILTEPTYLTQSNATGPSRKGTSHRDNDCVSIKHPLPCGCDRESQKAQSTKCVIRKPARIINAQMHPYRLMRLFRACVRRPLCEDLVYFGLKCYEPPLLL